MRYHSLLSGSLLFILLLVSTTPSRVLALDEVSLVPGGVEESPYGFCSFHGEDPSLTDSPECSTPSYVRISCPDGVTVKCDNGNRLTPDCTLHLPGDGTHCVNRRFTHDQELSPEEVKEELRRLRSRYGSVYDANQLIHECITAHELMHAVHATEEGKPMRACFSEIGAFDEEILCLRRGLARCRKKAKKEADCSSIERFINIETRAREYNSCLCTLNPDPWLDGIQRRTSGTWEESCDFCQDLTGVDDNYRDSYCYVNDPKASLIIG